MTQRRVGIYAGTFDPVHNGHVAFAKRARELCKLDEVVFFPDRSPWRKPNATAIVHRQALLERAVRDEQDMRVIALDIGRFTPRLVIPELKRLFGDDELVLLMGSDLAKSLHAWDSVDMLLAAVSLVIGLRDGDAAGEVNEAMERLAAAHGQVAYRTIEVSHPRVTSTAVRRGNHDALHPEVSAYIKRHGLYGAGT